MRSRPGWLVSPPVVVALAALSACGDTSMHTDKRIVLKQPGIDLSLRLEEIQPAEEPGAWKVYGTVTWQSDRVIEAINLECLQLEIGDVASRQVYRDTLVWLPAADVQVGALVWTGRVFWIFPAGMSPDLVKHAQVMLLPPESTSASSAACIRFSR